jgi:hypothetical protein
MTAALEALRVDAHGAPAKAPWARRLAGRRITAVALVVAADALLWGRPLGWAAALLGWLLLLALALSGGLRPRTWAVRTIYLLAALQVGALALHPTVLRVGLAALAIVATTLADRHGWTTHVYAWMRRFWSFGLQLPVKPLEDWIESGRHHRRLGRRPLSWTSPTRWVLPLGLGIAFVLLFTVANPLLDLWVTSATSRLGRWVERLAPLRVLTWVAVAWTTWGLLRVRAWRPTALPALPAPGAVWALAPTTLLRCLVVLNLVFALENGLDVSYLWLGRALPEGLTYAEYAQRGAYPLLAAALLAAGFVLATFRAGVDPQALRWPRRLVLLLLAQNVLLTAAALRRLALYVDAYSLTRWRVAAGLWMLLVAFGLVLVAVRILRGRSNAWLVRRCALASIVLVVGASWVPLDRWIADFNVARSAELAGPGHAPLDLGYLRTLGTGAVPAYDRLAAEAPDPALRAEARALSRAERAEVRDALSDWRGWTLRRAFVARLPEPNAR